MERGEAEGVFRPVTSGRLERGVIIEEFERVGDQIVDRVAREAADAGVESVSRTVVRGAPHRRILEYADDHDIDPIVVGTHGRTGLDHSLLGSVTETVVRVSDAPVLTVRADSEDDHQEPDDS